MTRRRKKKTAKRPGPGPIARLPLPRKSEKTHGDGKKYARPREKERLRRETE